MCGLSCLLQGLLGDCYGRQTVPQLLAEKEFEALTLQLSGDSAQLLTQWYQRDENALPTHYVLRPADGQAWHRAERRLASALHEAAQRAERCGLLSPEQRHCYRKSGVFWQGCNVILTRAVREESRLGEGSTRLCTTGSMRGRKRLNHLPDPGVGRWGGGKLVLTSKQYARQGGKRRNTPSSLTTSRSMPGSEDTGNANLLKSREIWKDQTR
nr:NACHT domain- and WD repeat-containing protein 1-like [Dromaius novaehollandiae]